MNEPHRKDELIAALRQTGDAITTYFSALPRERFFAGTEKAWSAAHHLQHLTQSNRPVAMGLGLPKLLLKIAVLGKAPQASRSYGEVRGLYRAALAAGRAQATGRYAPRLETDQQAQVVQDFAAAAESVAAAAERWSEDDLDAHAMPHPVLGQLSAREMLFFTLYHNSHHLEGVRARSG
ncbi:MAG: DinB family protein [Meiothermus sp.]|nr:DinB family protein [Meiothermus sp.]